MKVKEIREKIKKNIHICSKCVEELEWQNGRCPACGSDKFYPYYNMQGSELKRG